MKIYLDLLQKLTSTKDIVEFISNIYKFRRVIYTALINKWNFIGELGADFYAKKYIIL
jgi:hypothetical protein